MMPSPFEEEIEDMQRFIEYEKAMIRIMKAVMLGRPDSRGAELALQIIVDAKRYIRDHEARLEECRRKHFNWIGEQSA